ncbi:MAG: branched-chain amino acid transport system substrate-binding protein, partial [Rhodospirillaceae bacterium]|nr:branched-chain amino acid transport system substrate-binding protein [Rhodospirillaceae bacterium]
QTSYMIRSSILSWAGAVALVIVQNLTAMAASDHVKIGVLTDMSGAYSAIGGKGSVAAARLAIEDFGNEVLGKPIELVVADHTGKPDVGANLARQWYDQEGVDAIFDVIGSSVAVAVLELARSRNKIVAFSGAVSPDVIGKFCGETISSWAWDSYAMVATSMESLMRRQGGKRVFFLTLDSAVGRLLEGDATQIIKAGGGTVLGSVKHPLNTVDFSSFLLQAQAAHPDVIVLANAGSDTINAIKQAREFGLTTGANPITMAGLLAMINDVDALGLSATQGVVVSESFYWDLDEVTRAWNRRFQERVGTAANMLQAAVYSSVFHYLKAVKGAGTQDGKTVAAAMKAMPINDFYSHDLVLRADGRAVRDFYLFKVKTPEQSKQRWDNYEILNKIPGAEAFPAARSECPLLKSK